MGAAFTLPLQQDQLCERGDVTGHGSVGFRTCRASVFQHILYLSEGPQARFRLGRHILWADATFQDLGTNSCRPEAGGDGVIATWCSPSFPVRGCLLGSIRLGKGSQNHVTQTFLLLTSKRHRIDLKKILPREGIGDNPPRI